MSIEPGQTLPDASFATMTEHGPEPVDSGFFAGKTVVLFGLPGAFTPTCSARHLPGFVEKADALRAKGVDAIACTSVNDVFVMDAWGKANQAEGKVILLADGNGDFARAIGLTMDGSRYGMGERSQRYAMIVKDGVVDQLFVEAPGEYRVSAVEHVLEAL
ncbi:peroxiredoxin [Sphingomonas morindae]|uniref:Glutathione-dependent peroxiredoxin n=1 Tax=Sphingomonas morindae TaxID=1541170 RepID=A0ABY4X6Z6_9SPHN|nr:peroxiredoxin [Sphingomonas morindae]USI72666.1 peroxiredoxin [Sphingomonas morindae]